MRLLPGVLLLLPQLVFAATESLQLTDSVSHPFRVNASDHLILSSAKDDVDKTAAATQLFLNEAKVHGEYGNASGDIHITNRYSPANQRNLNKYFTLEKKTWVYETANWDVKLGDSHQELGRGIALSLFAQPAFGVDNTLEGGAVRVHPKNIEVGVFAGRVNVLKAPVAINPQEMLMKKKDIYLAGLSTTVAPFNDTKLGGHYLLTLEQRLDNHTFTKRFHTAGLTLNQENIFDSVDAYVESNVMLTDYLTPTTSKTQPNSSASYASVSWSPSPWKVKADVKHYRQFAYQDNFRRPPSLEEDVPLNHVENNYTDISAMKIYGERRFEGVGTFYSSMLTGEDRVLQSRIHHAVVGSKLPIVRGMEIELKGGYRLAPNHNNISHGALKTKVKTFKGQMVEFGVRKEYSQLGINATPYQEDRNIIDVTYTFSERFNVSLGYELIPTNSEETGKNFLNAGAAYKTGALTSRAFVGQTSGGTQCAGGVCRLVPAYTGAMVDATVAF